MNNSGSTEQPLIDVQAISKELKVRPEIYKNILRSFVSSFPDKLKVIYTTLSEENINMDLIHEMAHELKGIASNLRLPTILALSSLMLNSKNLVYIKSLADKLTDESVKFESFVKNMG